ncbi:MAG: hypothetical protein M1527_06765, partial [Gammaproteobacteria bacterium]|nr:hypothetical protein [Gammaproteobacteria bacterium]
MSNLINFAIDNFYGIATVLLTAAVGAYFLWRNNYKTRRANACAAFRAAIERELGPMLTKFPTSIPEIDGRLKQSFPALESAVREFRYYVPWWKTSGFNRAWLRYHCAYPDNWSSGQCYHHYLGS